LLSPILPLFIVIPTHLVWFDTKINAYEFILIGIVLRCDLPVFDSVKVDFKTNPFSVMNTTIC